MDISLRNPARHHRANCARNCARNCAEAIKLAIRRAVQGKPGGEIKSLVIHFRRWLLPVL